MSPIDLHTHSDQSDGALPPAQLVARAASLGVKVLALTDHDTIDGLDEARAAAAQHGIAFVDGVEISVTWSGRTIHIVGLGIDPQCSLLAAGLQRLRAGRRARAAAIARRLEGLGIAGVFEGAAALSATQSMLGRTHIARYLVAVGAVKDMKTAFRRYLGEGKPGHVKHVWIDMVEAIGLIRGAGGIAVLAHPGRYGLSPARLAALLNEFRELGGFGAEVVTASHTADQVMLVARLANQAGLAASAGSDFHSPDESWFDLGGFDGLPASCTPIWHAEKLRHSCRAA